MKSIEQQLAEATEQVKTLTTKCTAQEESVKTANKAVARGELSRLMTEAKLPEPIAKLLQKQYAEAEKTDGMKESIDAFAQTIREAGVVKKNNGPGDNGASAEADAKTKHDSLVKAFQENFGVTKEQAELMAE